MTLTAEERHIKLRAQMIRKRFRRATETIREIVDSLTDEQLVAQEDAHHQVRCETLAAKAETRKTATAKVSLK